MKESFTIKDLNNANIILQHLKKDTKCNEVKIFEEGKLVGVKPIKILEKVTSKIQDRYGSYEIVDILGEYFFKWFLKNKKSRKLKDKEVDSIEVSNDFIRFNLKDKGM